MANNVLQVKRTSTAGRTPNTTGSYATNSQYIAAGELALNMTDKILYTSDGTNLITVGANSPSYSTGSGYGTATGGAVVNATTIAVGNSSVNVTINSTAFSGTSNNSTNLGGTAASGYQTTAGLSSNVATLTSNNATNLGGVAAASYVNTAGNYTLAGNINFTGTNVYHTSTLYVGGQVVVGAAGDIVLANGSGIQANGTWGTAGQALLTDGSGNDYWGLPTVLTANNASYLGTVAAANYQGTANLSSAVALLSANNSSYLGGTAAASYQLNSTLSANVATLSSNNSSYLGGVAAASYVNTSGTYTITGAHTYSANVSLTGGTITTLATNSTDIVNKQYADAIATGVNFHAAVRLVTNTDLGTVTYNNGTSGVGATLTKITTFAALVVDTVTAAYQDRILVRAQTNTALNGIYTVSNTGNASSAWVLTRATDYDYVGSGYNEIDKGDLIYVTEGSVGTGTSWVESATVTTIGTDPITFVQFSSKALYALTGGTGLYYAVGAAYDGSAATTLAVNSSYIATISANNASYLGTVAAASYQGTANLAAAVALLPANNASYLGGTIASSYLANTSYGLSQNTSGIFVVAGTGTVVNATGVHVNATYIGTISANNASYLGGTAAASYQLNSTLSANIAAYLPTYTGVVNAASFTTGGGYGSITGGFVANSTVIAIGNSSVNVTINSTSSTATANNSLYLGGTAAASYALLASPTFTGTTTAAALNVTNQTNTATLYVTTSANVGTYFTVNSSAAVKAVNASFTGANLSIGGTNTYITSNTLITGTLTSAANLNINNAKSLNFQTVNTSTYVSFIQQNDDNFVMYSTNTAYGQRAIWSIFANSITSNMSFSVRTVHNGGLTIPSGATLFDSTGVQGTAGQVLTSNGTGNVYWSTVSSGASYTFSTGLTNTANTITVNAAYIATISANNASYLGTVAAASYQGTANLAAAVALLPANNASYLGGTIASSYLANTSAGLSQNTSGIFVVAGTGTVVNATGVHVNSSYIATISANNASYLGTVAAASYQGTANLAAAVALLPANNASYLGGTAAASYALLASPTFTGTVTTANTLTIGTAAYHVANGNLGIGTSSPAATLDVVGTVNTSKANTLQQTLTDGVTISWDTSLGQVATVTLAGNRTMAAPTNLKVQTYILHVLQDATGSRTLTWNAVFKWPAGVAPTLTTTASARDIFSFVSDGTNLYGSLLPNVK